MATKSATVLIVDLGASTADCHNGRVESDLEYGTQYIWDSIVDSMAKSSSNVGVIGFRTNETDNPLADDDEAYQNICILKPLGPMIPSAFIDLQEKIKSSQTQTGDAVSAIVLGITLIEEFTTLKSGKPGKYDRKIALLTDGEGSIDDEDIDPIAAKINEVGINLVVLGIDFDDAIFGVKEEDKSKVKRKNETILQGLSDKCTTSTFATAAAAIADLATPKVKVTKPYSPYKGKLTLGDDLKFPDTAMCIDVERYFRTKVAKPVSASSFVIRSGASGTASQQSSHTIQADKDMLDNGGGDMAPVRTARFYEINNPDGANGRQTVEYEELAKGYEYGRTAVHVSKSDEDVTVFETVKKFEIVGFIPSNMFEKYLNMGESCITIPMQANDKARIALSSFVRALHELDSYAVARLVLKDMKEPNMILLAPLIEPDLEALVDIPLPFAEDLRVYRFPPLDKVITTSGTTLTKHRNLPSEDLVDAMSAYVDGMDLSSFGKDEEGQPEEYASIQDTFSPMVHRISQAIKRRAIRPNEPIPPPAEVLIKYSQPPPELVLATAQELENLVKVANVKKVPPKAKGKRRREQIKPISGLDVDSILGSEKRQKISGNNSIAEFKQMLATGEDDDVFSQAVKQLGTIIREYIKTSTGDSKYGQALENIHVMREEMINLEEPEMYNDFMWDLKKQILGDKLGDSRKDFWLAVKEHRLGLIDSAEAPASDISKAKASEFFSLRTGIPDRSKNA